MFLTVLYIGNICVRKNQVSVVQKTLTNRSTARCETKNVKTEVIDLDDDSENVAGLVAEDDESCKVVSSSFKSF